MKFKLNIIYEDGFISAINKPPGLVVNVSQTSPSDTLQDLVFKKYSKVFKECNPKSVFFEKGGLVHRLDKETSGIILFAKTEDVFSNLQMQFKGRGVKKEYIALVHEFMIEDYLEISAPLGRNPNNRVKMAVVEGGKEALTFVEKVEEIEYKGWRFTLVKVFPKTGRTHQIRVHLAAMNHTIVGDNVYSGRRQLKSRELFSRLMLHAHEIEFLHPGIKEKMSLTAPLPREFDLSEKI